MYIIRAALSVARIEKHELESKMRGRFSAATWKHCASYEWGREEGVGNLGGDPARSCGISRGFGLSLSLSLRFLLLWENNLWSRVFWAVIFLFFIFFSKWMGQSLPRIDTQFKGQNLNWLICLWHPYILYMRAYGNKNYTLIFIFHFIWKKSILKNKNVFSFRWIHYFYSLFLTSFAKPPLSLSLFKRLCYPGKFATLASRVIYSALTTMLFTINRKKIVCVFFFHPSRRPGVSTGHKLLLSDNSRLYIWWWYNAISNKKKVLEIVLELFIEKCIANKSDDLWDTNTMIIYDKKKKMASNKTK